MSSFNEESRGRRPSGDAPLSPVALEARRQLALDRLTNAFASDLVTMEDYESRVARVQSANLPEEIEGQVSDLPQVIRKAEARPSRGGRRADAGDGYVAVPYRNAIDPRLRGEESVACIMGNRTLQGDFLSGDKIDSFTMMGNTQIDLRDTALPPGRLKIDAFCMMGNLKVVVPHGLPVKMNGFPFMGNVHVGRDVERKLSRDEPYVEVNGFAFMGNLSVVALD
jgi:hypothetical protein